jgi:hypothetical protein
MGLARYFIVRHEEEWLVTLEGRIMGRHGSRADAIGSAIVMADLMGAMHHDADVMEEGADGKTLDTIWVFGQDAVPPTGQLPPQRTDAKPEGSTP